MKRKLYFFINKFSVLIALLLCSLKGGAGNDSLLPYDISSNIEKLMRKGNIPGLSVVIVAKKRSTIVNFGYSDVSRKVEVSSKTLFEIGSASKAFTALAALKLEKDGLLNLEEPVSKYLPGFSVKYKNEECQVTINQLLHHTSGIPFKSISGIPEDNSENALENTVAGLKGCELNFKSGTSYEYATINYDVVGLIIKKVSGLPFEEFIEKNILLPLGLNHTKSGRPADSSYLAVGYKIGFLAPRKYGAPVFKGNNPAGYIISSPEDMERWLKIQMGLIRTGFDSLITRSHTPDLSVAPFQDDLSYGYGWMVNQYKHKEIKHGGYNPNYTSFIEFLPSDSLGVVVLANSNSVYTEYICQFIINKIKKEPIVALKFEDEKIDIVCSVLAAILGLFILSVFVFIVFRARLLIRQKTKFERFTKEKLRKLLIVTVVCIPYLYGIYLIPEALIGFSWTSIFVWMPVSFAWVIFLLLGAITMIYLFYCFASVFPGKNKYTNSIPFILFLSILSGLANAAILFIITSAIYSEVALGYLLYYFVLAYGLYLIAVKVSQTKMIRLTNEMVFDIRVFLIRSITRTRFQDFEKISDGTILTALNGDTMVLAGSANVLIGLITDCITIFSAFLYLSFISWSSTLIMLVVISLLAWYYYFVSVKASVFLEKARDISNSYMSMLNQLINGFRELSIHRKAKKQFVNELVGVSKVYEKNNIVASVKFLNSTILGNSFIMIVLGILSILMPRVSFGVDTATLVSFVMVVLYMIGPINGVLGVVSGIANIKIAWRRITEFIAELKGPDDKTRISFLDMIKEGNVIKNEHEISPDSEAGLRKVERIEITELTFAYKSIKAGEASPDEIFRIGPINLDVSKGEIVFITGKNGSGKSTLVHLLTGLYLPETGAIKINGEQVDDALLGEYFSVIFGGSYIFQKLYGIDLHGKGDKIDELLKRFRLEEKVAIIDGEFSTINLSIGQKKRLSLLRCFLDDRQVFLFDELAADQDPEFRSFFYNTLLQEMKRQGKIVIAITHDDNYFHVADKILQLDFGKSVSVSLNQNKKG